MLHPHTPHRTHRSDTHRLPARVAALLLGLGLSCTACSDHSDELFSARAADPLLLSATATAYVQATRSGDDQIKYRIYAVSDDALNNTDTRWTDDGAYLAAVNATMDAKGLLGTTATTSGYITGTTIPTDFGGQGETWNFVGITVSNDTDPADIAPPINATDAVTLSDKGAPCYYFSYQGEEGKEKLPDVRTAYTRKNITETVNGEVELNFKHDLVKIEVYISHPDQQEDKDGNTAPWTDTYTVTQCDVVVPTGGTLDLSRIATTTTPATTTSLWDLDETTRQVSIIDPEKTKISFSTTQQSITDPTDGFLIFPCHQFTLLVKEKNDDTPKELTVQLSNEDLNFEANHAYTILVQYYRDGVFVITAHPDYYDYVDAAAEVLTIGTPTLFNGLVWSDRNIGATSNTYGSIREWEEMRGYFYQAGRNIPYKIYPLKEHLSADNTYYINDTYTHSTTDDQGTYYWIQTNGDVGISSATNNAVNAALPKSIGRYLYPYIPELWDDIAKLWNYGSFTLRKNNYSTYNFYPSSSIKVYFYNEDKTTSTTADNNRMFVTSTDYKKYLYLNLPTTVPSRSDFSTEDEYKSYLEQYLFVYNTGTNWRAGTSSGLWANLITPCPPGWRIPTNDEWKSIVPVSMLTGDITYLFHHTQTNATYKAYRHKDYDDVSWFEESTNDPATPYNSQYYGDMPDGPQVTDSQKSGEIYCVKKVGTNAAYGLRIYIDKSLAATSAYDRPDSQTSAVPARAVFVIEQYTFSDAPAKVSLSLKNHPRKDPDNGLLYTYDIDNENDSTRQKIYWYHGDKLTFPACGVGQYYILGLIWSGTEAQYATAEGRVVRMKAGGTIYNRFIYLNLGTLASDYRTACLSIRPVRDVTSEDW
jgi:hypothetical protein